MSCISCLFVIVCLFLYYFGSAYVFMPPPFSGGGGGGARACVCVWGEGGGGWGEAYSITAVRRYIRPSVRNKIGFRSISFETISVLDSYYTRVYNYKM